MARPRKPLDTIWEVPDALWARILPILQEDCPPPANIGRPRADWRRIFNGIVFRLRTGCQWNKLPAEFGDDSTVHRWFQRWCRNGVMKRIWAMLVAECDELKAVAWDWQAVDGAMGKARFGGIASGPTPRIAARPAPRRACSSTSGVVRSAR